jgi:hypothetical protein
MTTDKKPKGILFDPTVLQWSGPDGRPIDCPFSRVPGPEISANPDVLRKLGISPDGTAPDNNSPAPGTPPSENE